MIEFGKNKLTVFLMISFFSIFEILIIRFFDKITENVGVVSSVALFVVFVLFNIFNVMCSLTLTFLTAEITGFLIRHNIVLKTIGITAAILLVKFALFWVFILR